MEHEYRVIDWSKLGTGYLDPRYPRFTACRLPEGMATEEEKAATVATAPTWAEARKKCKQFQRREGRQ